MPFQNSNGFNNQNNAQGEKKRTNFPVGRLYATDAILNITVWVSDSTVYTIFSAKQAVGKDPSTGANVYEQKMPNELPRIFMNPEYLRAFVEAAKQTDITKGGELKISPKRGSTLTVTGNNGQVKITMETEKGSRTATFEPITCGSATINSSWRNLITFCEVALKKALYAKLNPEEFSFAMGGGEESLASVAVESATELPI